MFLLEQIARFIDPAAIAIVLGGTLITTIFRAPWAHIGRAFAALGLLGKADPTADAAAARISVSRIRELAEVRSINCVDRVETAQRFLMRAARELSEARSSRDFARWAIDEIEGRRLRHQAAIGVWRAIAEAGPSMGMIGTIIGLVQMFAQMDDPSTIGPAMAVAMLTTLYGIILSAGIAAPVAGRLESLSETELAWQMSACKQLELLARDELDAAPQGRPARPAFRTAA
ncbi:motility protein A [Sphingomonas sp. SRS2]|uniref:motility protein A n=1 Tax=Sphingomonas sp. SRS2 TaxID=133190 RepID=UPI000618470E|nr:MotA/TolQ/ExbB proton channel family protein [Sphingomonas sp. SRS2]KKC25293.1 flagellar motor protein [Sphingomonas sp. SRS2]